MRRLNTERGFTFLELLVVIALIIILLTLLVTTRTLSVIMQEFLGTGCGAVGSAYGWGP